MVDEDIFLVIDQQGAQRMLKNPPKGKLNRGSIVLKVHLRVHSNAFREPTLVREIEVTDWQEGIPFGDVEFKQKFITENEAATIREARLAEVVALLQSSGYQVYGPPRLHGSSEDEGAAADAVDEVVPPGAAGGVVGER